MKTLVKMGDKEVHVDVLKSVFILCMYKQGKEFLDSLNIKSLKRSLEDQSKK